MGSFSRREFLRLAAAGAAGALIGCGAEGGGGDGGESSGGDGAPRPPSPSDAAEPAAGRAYEVIEVANGGVVRGRVTFVGERPRLDLLQADTTILCCDPHLKPNPSLVVGEGAGVRHAVVCLEGVARGKAPEPGPFVVADEHCMFTPHVLCVPLGGPLRYENRDPVTHQFLVKSERTDEKISSVMIAEGTAPHDVPETSLPMLPGVLTVVSDTHWWEFGYIFVHDSPYYAITDEEGRYEITDVPPGKYRLRLWHEDVVAPQDDLTKAHLKRLADPASEDGVEITVGGRGEVERDFTIEVLSRQRRRRLGP